MIQYQQYPATEVYPTYLYDGTTQLYPTPAYMPTYEMPVAYEVPTVPVEGYAPPVGYGATEYVKEPEITAKQFKTLFRFNLLLGIIHLITGATILAITDSNTYVWQTTQFPNATSYGGSRWLPQVETHYNVAPGYFAGVSLILSATDHLLVALPCRKIYEGGLLNHRNDFRWAEYSLSASFMHICIAMIAGIMDIHMIFMIFGLTFVTMLFGSEMERTNAHLWGMVPAKSFRPFWYGCVPHIFNWAVILCYFFRNVSKASSAPKSGDAPEFVWAIIFVIFILDSTFAINMFLQQREIGKWKVYYFGELIFCVLSLVAKQLLAWLYYGGAAAFDD